MAALLDLPDELIQEIFTYLPATSAAAFGSTSLRLNKISLTPLLWRDYCRSTWRYWEVLPDRPDPIGGDISSDQWRELFVQKHTLDQEALHEFDELLSTQQFRLERMQSIAEHFRYDAKDLFLGLLQTPDDADDVLARRYYSDAILGLIHRTRALQIWDDMQWQDFPALESSLGAFDLFVQSARDTDVAHLMHALDEIVDDIRKFNPNIDELDYQSKAVVIVKHLRSRHLVGASEQDFHLLRNNFMCLALTGDATTSLPLQSVSVFCCVAQRFGIRAWPCNFPFVIHAVVESPDYPPLRETRATFELNPGVVWMDPFHNDNIVSQQTMRSQLGSMAVTSEDVVYAYLSPAYTRDMVLRTGRNIMRSVNEAREHREDLGEQEVDADAAFYSFLWSILMFGPNNTRDRQNYVPYLLEHFKQHFPEDIGLIERYLLPMYNGHPALHQLIGMIEDHRIADRNARPITSRDENCTAVKYRVGQYFRHLRYHYVGIIVGWDSSCRAGEQWISQMGVTDLPRGREQSFYHILAADKSSRYVAEENIIPLSETPSQSLMKLAGRHFKRWDDDAKVFISNIKDEYPDN
ncbi:hypothetical protein MBLNU459_g2592t1 [Dothideomycetes sp. NU459]